MKYAQTRFNFSTNGLIYTSPFDLTLRADTSQTKKRKRIAACEPVSVEEVAAHCSFSQGNALNIKCVIHSITDTSILIEQCNIMAFRV